MSHSLTVKAFFFNSKTDYLPYYKQFTCTLEESATARDILLAIKAQNDDFHFPQEKLIFKVNGWVVTTKTTVKSLCDKLGHSLQVDPVNSYRSMNGLEIKDNDFEASFELLAPYTTSDDKAYYDSLYALHYASESEKYDHQYIGDALLLTAHKMIEAKSEYTKEILDVISRHPSGLGICEYENNLFEGQSYHKEIATLKSIVYSQKEGGFLSKIQKSLFKKEQNLSKVYSIEDLEEKTIAYYHAGIIEKATLISEKITALGTQEIHFARASRLSGLSVIKSSREMGLKKAGLTLMDAFDSGTQVLVVENKEVLSMFRANYKAIEKVSGREFSLELLSYDDFILQANLIHS